MARSIEAEDLKRLQMKKGDILVVQMPPGVALSHAQLDSFKGRLHFTLQQAGMHAVPIMLLEHGMSVSVVNAKSALKEADEAKELPPFSASLKAAGLPPEASADDDAHIRRIAGESYDAALVAAKAAARSGGDDDAAAFA